MKPFFSFVESLITIILVMVGIVGLAYSGFRDGGWVTTGFGKVVDVYLDTPLIALSLTAAAFFSYRAYRGHLNQGRGGKAHDWIAYLLMAAGVYFLARYFMHGQFGF